MSAHLTPRVLGWAAPRRRLSPPAVLNLIFIAPPLMIVAIAAMTVNPVTNLVDIVGLSCIEPAHMLG